uniref:SH2 domain-containing protein n=2 Tax=Plectus sambesii TaxID=2011161 RepID=A0A914VEC3_9BILA
MADHFGYPPGSLVATLRREKPMEVIHHHPVFVKDTSKYWYKPSISREDAINMLKDKPPGTFVVRDSNSFPGAFGLALKVASAPPGVQPKTADGTELVRHFLIEPSPKGVKLKGCNNEPVFGTLSALVYQHSITPLALPCKLLLPEYDPAASPEHLNAAQALLEQGAACNVTYVLSCDTESLTGPEAVRRCVAQAYYLLTQKQIIPVSVHFKVSSQGITVTDNSRKLFFRRHYPVHSVTFSGMDPDDRRWELPAPVPEGTQVVRSARIFGFVAKKLASRTDNACHIFAELEPEQPATAVVNFITKVMMGQAQQNQQRQQLNGK